MSEQETILLVDDSENDHFMMRRAFKKAGFNNPLQEVHNGEQAMAYLQGEGIYNDREKFPVPSAVLLDLNMPMKNGFDVLSWARTHPDCKRLSIIVMTASMRAEDVERAFELGASSYLVKPSEINDLVSMILCLRGWFRINHFPPLNGMVKK